MWMSNYLVFHVYNPSFIYIFPSCSLPFNPQSQILPNLILPSSQTWGPLFRYILSLPPQTHNVAFIDIALLIQSPISQSKFVLLQLKLIVENLNFVQIIIELNWNHIKWKWYYHLVTPTFLSVMCPFSLICMFSRHKNILTRMRNCIITICCKLHWHNIQYIIPFLTYFLCFWRNNCHLNLHSYIGVCTFKETDFCLCRALKLGLQYITSVCTLCSWQLKNTVLQ